MPLQHPSQRRPSTTPQIPSPTLWGISPRQLSYSLQWMVFARLFLFLLYTGHYVSPLCGLCRQLVGEADTQKDASDASSSTYTNLTFASTLHDCSHSQVQILSFLTALCLQPEGPSWRAKVTSKKWLTADTKTRCITTLCAAKNPSLQVLQWIQVLIQWLVDGTPSECLAGCLTSLAKSIEVVTCLPQPITREALEQAM